MRNILIAACLLALIGFGKCNIKCYTCNSLEEPNCEHPRKHKMATHECVPTHLTEMKNIFERTRLTKLISSFDVHIHKDNYDAHMNCLKLVAKGDDNKDVIVRGCQLAAAENHGDICRKVLKDKKDEVKYCSLCNENACNGSSYITGTLSFALIPLLILCKGLMLR